MAKELWFLKQCQLFERLPDAELVQLERECRGRNLAGGEVVYLPAEEANAVLALTYGRVKICNVTSDGKEAILAFIEPGEIFGEHCLFDRRGREEMAVAVQKSRVVLIPERVMTALMSRHGDLALSVTRMIGFRRHRVEKRLKSLLFHSNRDRLVHLLLELVETYGERTDEGMNIRLRLSHQDLASVIGSTRETVTATLGELQTQNLVKIGRQKLVVLDGEGLAGLLGGSAREENQNSVKQFTETVRP